LIESFGAKFTVLEVLLVEDPPVNKLEDDAMEEENVKQKKDLGD
jgi:hypothetical protein